MLTGFMLVGTNFSYFRMSPVVAVDTHTYAVHFGQYSSAY